jgi:ubiquitin C-terminal hydrolase
MATLVAAYPQQEISSHHEYDEETVRESNESPEPSNDVASAMKESSAAESAHPPIALDVSVASDALLLLQQSSGVNTNNTSADEIETTLDEIFAAEDESDGEEFLPAFDAMESPRKADFSSYSVQQPEKSPVATSSVSAWPSLSAWITPASSVPYGGLSNLGNTCYMASALQMIASLESFLDELKANEPTTNADTKLRTAFLDIMDRLQTATVVPDAFKDAVDERSPLFLGFRQQDSHEFLTTLLDLLDEDYKNKEKEDDDKKESMDIQDESEASADHDTVSCKKPRTEVPSNMMEVDEASSSMRSLIADDSCRSATSFSDLDVDAIGRLLHGDRSEVTQSDVLITSIVESEQPHYKLIGGRMNTADVVLTPYADYDASQHPTRGDQATSTRMEATNGSAENDTDDDASPATQSPIDTTFTTQVRVRLTCDSCKYTRCHKETFLHLSLEIGSNSDICSNVEDGLRRFFAPCTQELKCEKCFCETATQTTEITKLPSALLLHLKRFIVDVSPDWSNISYRKNQSAVSFDEELTLDEEVGVLSEFLASDCTLPTTTSIPQKYALRSVVNHIGSSANCGHYTADAKRMYGEKREWTRFNDSYVSRISGADATEQSRQTAYMCLYELE